MVPARTDTAADLSRRRLRPSDRRAETPLPERLGRVTRGVTTPPTAARSLHCRHGHSCSKVQWTTRGISNAKQYRCRQVESVIAELARHRRVLSTHVTELRDLLETMEAVTRLVRAVARCSDTSTIGGGGGSVFLTFCFPSSNSTQLAVAVRSLAISVRLTRGKIAAHLRSRKAAPRRRRREHASA